MRRLAPQRVGAIFRRNLWELGRAVVSDEKDSRALAAHIERGYLQAERGELIDGAQARREIQAMKDDWGLSKRL